jgi:hypothetical protein
MSHGPLSRWARDWRAVIVLALDWQPGREHVRVFGVWPDVRLCRLAHKAGDVHLANFGVVQLMLHPSWREGYRA